MDVLETKEIRIEAARLLAACHDAIAQNAQMLTALDSVIGDGDHGANMGRGFGAVMKELSSYADVPIDRALAQAGRTLLMNIGGAAGPLYGTFLIELGAGLDPSGQQRTFPEVFKDAVDAVAQRGRSGPGDKTLLDVLYCTHFQLCRNPLPDHVSKAAHRAAQETIAMQARRGRAAYLGSRSIGHMDPGACSCALLISAVCACFEDQRN